MGELANIMSRPMPIFVTGFGRFFIKPHVPPPPSSQEVFEEEAEEVFQTNIGYIRIVGGGTPIPVYVQYQNGSSSGGRVPVVLFKLPQPNPFLTLMGINKNVSYNGLGRLSGYTTELTFSASSAQRQFLSAVTNAPDDATMTLNFTLFSSPQLKLATGSRSRVSVSWVFNKTDLKKMLAKQRVTRVVQIV